MAVTIMSTNAAQSLRLLRLLQLVSPSLPVGAYSYSEGLETLTQTETISDRETLQHWLSQELRVGAAQMEGSVMVRAYRALQEKDAMLGLRYWNQWYGAARETEELRNQSLQMGRSMMKVLQGLASSGDFDRLLLDPLLDPLVDPVLDPLLLEERWHFPIAFAIVAVAWEIALPEALLGYFQSWSSNLIAAGIKLIPLGQTDGQRIGWAIQESIAAAVLAVLALDDDDLGSCGWGVALASMQHERLYSRLFRS